MREDLDTPTSLGARRNAQRAVIENVGPGEVLVKIGAAVVGDEEGVAVMPSHVLAEDAYA